MGVVTMGIVCISIAMDPPPPPPPPPPPHLNSRSAPIYGLPLWARLLLKLKDLEVKAAVLEQNLRIFCVQHSIVNSGSRKVIRLLFSCTRK